MLRVYVKEKGSRELYPKAHGQLGMGTWMPSTRSLGAFEVAVEYWPKHMLCRKQQTEHITSPVTIIVNPANKTQEPDPSPKSSLPSGHHPALPCRCLRSFRRLTYVKERGLSPVAAGHALAPHRPTTVPTKYVFQRTEGGCPGDKTAEGGDSHGYCSLGYYVLTPPMHGGEEGRFTRG